MKKAILISVVAAASTVLGCGTHESRDDCATGGSGGGGSFGLVEAEGTWMTAGSGTEDSYLGGGSSGYLGGGSDDGCRGRMADSASPTSVGAAYSEGAVADDATGAAGKGMPYEPDGSGQQVGPGILTAGSFDDGLNMEVFLEFWNGEPDQMYSWEADGPVDLPSLDDFSPPARFSGAKPAALDLSLVVDATGSMGDELEYIKAELENISTTIKERYPQVTQRFSLIVYRDETDFYITRGIELSEDLANFKLFLSDQFAGGGGDYPEAMHTALAEAESKLEWGDDNTAKIMFLIADAPPHAQSVPDTLAAVDRLIDKGVHIYPVAASGVADLAERVMRLSALKSGGEYIFLTDDSGVGLPHVEPHIPCYQVQKLNNLMVHVIASELEQERIEPDQSNILRSIGSSVDGVCELVEQ